MTHVIKYTGQSTYRNADGVSVSEADPYYETDDDGEAEALTTEAPFEEIDADSVDAARDADATAEAESRAEATVERDGEPARETQTEGPSAPAESPSVPPGSPDAVVNEFPVLNGNLGDLEDTLATGEYDAELQRLDEAETNAKDRGGAHERIQNRMNMLDTDAETETDTAESETETEG